jgi:hypothetical protein
MASIRCLEEPLQQTAEPALSRCTYGTDSEFGVLANQAAGRFVPALLRSPPRHNHRRRLLWWPPYPASFLGSLASGSVAERMMPPNASLAVLYHYQLDESAPHRQVFQELA